MLVLAGFRGRAVVARAFVNAGELVARRKRTSEERGIRQRPLPSLTQRLEATFAWGTVEYSASVVRQTLVNAVDSGEAVGFGCVV